MRLCSAGGSGGGVVARDALGRDILADAWLATHPAGDRTLAEGLKVRRKRETISQAYAHCLFHAWIVL